MLTFCPTLLSLSLALLVLPSDFAGGTNFVLVALLTFLLGGSYYTRQIFVTVASSLWGPYISYVTYLTSNNFPLTIQSFAHVLRVPLPITAEGARVFFPLYA